MAEFPTSLPVPQKDDDLAIIDGAALQTEPGRDHFASLKALLPEVRDGDLNGVLAALGTAGKLDAFHALLADPVRWNATKAEFLAQLSHAAPNDPWIGPFVEIHAKAGSDSTDRAVAPSADMKNVEARERAALERARDIKAFDTLIARNPDILFKLKARWIDLDAEKASERERFKAANPSASEDEIGAHAVITVYLRHQDAIRSAAPDDAVGQQLAAGFEVLQKHAREAEIPYQEPIRYAKGILPLDKAAMLAVTTWASLDTWTTRSGNTLSIASRTDGFVQVWTVNPGERPEKSVELPNWPRIRIASVPEPDTAILERKRKAIDRIAEITGWDWVRTSEGMEAAKSRFPKSLEASVSDAECAPAAWRAFVLAYGTSGEEQGKALVAAMGERTAQIADPGLRQRMSEALDAMVGTKRELGDHGSELMPEIGRKNLAAIEAESSEAKARAEKKRDGFERAVRTVAEANLEEERNVGGFRQEVVHAEGIARDNLAYFRDNGFLALGPHFDEFLASVNRNQLAINPSADGQFALPKVLSENDRALLARGLVRAMGETANLADWFEVPGYRLKSADASGEITADRIRSNLEKSGVLKDGKLRSTALEKRLGTWAQV